MNYKHIIYFIIVAFLVNCGNKSIEMEEDLILRFNKAMNFFEKGKYPRARDEFDYIIMTDPGSQLASESQYYKGESLFNMKEYDEAGVTLDRYVRFANDINKIEKARYRICECALLSSNFYQRDQKETIRALDQLQMFIEDFPESELIPDSERAIADLRLKLAQKAHEVGRLYLKLEEYESALIYFRYVLNNYYDTDFADDARIGIIFSHILDNNRQGAISYLNAEKGRFLSFEKYREAESFINDTEEGLKLVHYFHLYK